MNSDYSFHKDFSNHSTWKLKLHGTPVERDNAEWISRFLPDYANVWECFIGRVLNEDKKLQPAHFKDKKGKPVDLPPSVNRLAFALYNYTVLETLLALEDVRKEIDNPDLRLSVSGDLITISRYQFQVYGLIDRLRESLSKAACYLAARDIEQKPEFDSLKSMAKLRQNAVHDVRLPLIEHDGVAMILDLEEQLNSGSQQYMKDYRDAWLNSANESNSKYVVDLWRKHIDRAFCLLNSCYSALYSRVRDILDKNELSIATPDETHRSIWKPVQFKTDDSCPYISGVAVGEMTPDDQKIFYIKSAT